VELYHNNMSVCAQKVRLVLAEKNLQPTEYHMNLRNGDTHTPEYLRLNPKGVVPTLVDDGAVIVESTVICEYLEEAYPDIPLRPAAPLARAGMRQWTLLPDTALHQACGFVSVGVAWRHQMIAAGGAQLANRSKKAAVSPAMLDIIKNGVESPHMQGALQVYDQVIESMAQALSTNEWLAGNEYTLADASLLPYVLRLEHLAMDWMWADEQRHAVQDWYERSRQRANYRAIADYIIPEYVALAKEKGTETAAELKAMLGG